MFFDGSFLAEPVDSCIFITLEDFSVSLGFLPDGLRILIPNQSQQDPGNRAGIRILKPKKIRYKKDVSTSNERTSFHSVSE